MRIINAAILLSALISPLVVAQEQPPMPPAQVSVVQAKIRLLAPTSPLSGSVISINDSSISTQVSGELSWLAQIGDKVTKGQVIAEVDATRYKLAVQIADSTIRRLEADLNFRKQEVTRLKELAVHNNTSQARLQEETAKQNMLIQEIRAASAALDEANYDLKLTRMTAPFDGHITQRFSSKGEFLAIGQALLRIVDTSNPEIALNAPIELLQFIKVGDRVEVQSKQKSDNLTIKSITPVGDMISRMMPIRLKLNDDHWVVGTPVNILMPNAVAKKRVSFPRDALVIKGSDVYIFRIGSDLMAEQISASIEAVDGQWVAIKADLAEDDQIVIRGGERLMPGQKVSLLPFNQ